jgi:two-component system, sensor histidine kinase FlrB
MNDPPPAGRGGLQVLQSAGESIDDATNFSQIAAAKQRPLITNAVLLADAFSDFIATSSRLEGSYRQLQAEVRGLGLELAERNAELNTSLAQNERMRLALQQVVDSMPCGVMVIEQKGEISMINPETGRLLGLDFTKRDQNCPATLQEIKARSGINLDRVFAGQTNADMEHEFCIPCPAGNRWLEIRNRRLFHPADRQGSPDQTILILRDITAQKRAEQDRESGRNAMALAEIATILAHEIRNPLAGLELFAELIESDTERQELWISNLRAGIRSLSGTVNNVLSLHSSGALKLVPLSLAALIVSAMQFIKPLADQAAVSLDWTDRSSDLRVKGNEGTLRQVLLNLFTNAIRHTPPGGRIAVSLHLRCDDEETELHGRSRGRAVLECSDSGCGIRPDQIEHIFETGFSGTGDTTGLGLAVCDRIMRQHHGRISVSNVLPSGARFLLEFPALPMETASA